MAEIASKRQGAAGKAPVATPKSPPPNVGTAPANNLVSIETALNAVIGARVRLQTTITMYPVLEGVVYLIDTTLNIVAIATRPPKTAHHIIAISALKDFELLPKDAFPLPSVPSSGPPPPLDTEALMARANAALAKAKEKAAKRNPSVSKEAQEIFDAMGRQFAVRWDGRDIVVMDQIVVRGPGYRGEDCKAGKDTGSAGQASLARVRKVLENERKRLTQRDPNSTPAPKGPKPVIPAIPAIPAFSGGPRKGG